MKILCAIFALTFASTASAFTLTSTLSTQGGWGVRPLRLFVNRANCPANLDESLGRAMALWNSVSGSSLKLEIGPDTTNSIAELMAGTATDVPMVACDAAFSETNGVDGNLIPGVGFISGQANPLEYGGLLLNVESGKDGDINTYKSTTLDVVVAHEIGHMLGIGHSNDTRSLMYYDASYKQHLSLSQDDIDAVNFLYPRNELGSLGMIGGCGSITTPDDPWWGGNSLVLLGAIYLAFAFAVSRRKLRTFRATV